MIQGLKSTIKEEPASATRTMSPLLLLALHESQVSRKEDSWDSSLAGSGAHDNGDKATRRGLGLDVKDIHPVNRALRLKLKQLSELLSSPPALWRSSDAVWRSNDTKAEGDCILSYGPARQ